ncbi:L-serine ammonia-lyase, iron-sulfur-dependent subunit beta [Lutispora thermophila]|uniref:L-serine deaminase n=1 Tax=Lutispora thermophila DSM 19022 TaxID=1122184 RepID=A0A1M6CD54_9FIRM|nr:L-serine ammonia-lyase, iron-sulfur-dependent subunit beta [Lutispora thermophila]SHI58927.1 L-serine ammonia-lyase [Lutispora thermophila DSM 19022]
MNLFDIIGPVMIGPSSSHTAGAARLGKLARNIFGEDFNKADITLYNSFAKTGQGHGTDKAIVAGILGMDPDDEDLRNAIDLSHESGIEVNLILEESKRELHPNTAKIILYGKDKTMSITGCSLGGGRVMIQDIDGFKTEFTGEFNTIISVQRDKPGIVAYVTSYLAQKNINIAQMKLSRRSKGDMALMIIETDETPPKSVKEDLEKHEGIYKIVISTI